MATIDLQVAGAADFERVFAYIQRQGDAEQLPASLRIDAETLRRDWFGTYRGEAAFASVGGRPAGFAVCLPNAVMPDFPNSLYFAGIFVEPDFRKQGVGRAFMAWLAERARVHGRNGILWCCLTDNHAALAFSTKVGAVELGERTAMSASGESRVVRLFGLEIPAPS